MEALDPMRPGTGAGVVMSSVRIRLGVMFSAEIGDDAGVSPEPCCRGLNIEKVARRSSAAGAGSSWYSVGDRKEVGVDDSMLGR